jgi:hypothetical protein
MINRNPKTGEKTKPEGSKTFPKQKKKINTPPAHKD